MLVLDYDLVPVDVAFVCIVDLGCGLTHQS